LRIFPDAWSDAMNLSHALKIRLAALLGTLTLLVSPAQAATAVARPIGAFDAVTLRAPVDLVLRQGPQPAVEVTADDKLQSMVVTEVVTSARGSTLEVRLKPGARLPLGAKALVTVDVVALRALAIDGAGEASGSGLVVDALDVSISGTGDVRLDKLQAAALELRIAGSGDIALAGRTGRLRVRIAGSGDVDAGALDADDVSVSISGSGDAQVRAAATLDVSIAGSGDVTYRGEPKLTQRISGSGTVAKR
jgi:hypothetical protein